MAQTSKSKSSAVANRRFWLFKSEPSVFSIDDLVRSPKQTSSWEGVRNYQARNSLRDDVQVGDHVFFYHSSEPPLGIFGTMEVVKAAYPDATAFDPQSPYYDPKSTREAPRWVSVDVKLLARFRVPLLRDHLADHTATAGMLVLKRGMRLSIQPVQPDEWAAVLALEASLSAT